MAQNVLPDKQDALLILAEDAADGLTAHGAAVGVLQNTEARVRADRTAVVNGEAAYAAAKTAKKTDVAAQTVQDSNGKANLGNARKVLAARYGEEWSEDWAVTGFPNQSTAVPSTMPERLALLEKLAAYFTANPTHENAPLGVTAANAQTRFTALSDARTAVNEAISVKNDMRKARDAAERQLRRRMRALIEELTGLLPLDDPLWFAFGLVPPAGEDTPDQPTALVLVAGPAGSGIVYADWADAARAATYRVEIQIVGTDSAFRFYESVGESESSISGLPIGATVRVRIIAVNNDNDESPPSDVVQIVMP